MAPREIKVVINGEEFVSKAAEDAGASLTVFGKKIPLVLDASNLLKMGLDALRAAFGAVKQFVGDSMAAFDEYNASQRKLEGTAKLSGIALRDLRDVANQGKDAFKLSTVVANDFSSEIGKLTSKAGDITKSKDAMASFLDIGAARGLSAADTLKAVQQAVLGIDEGTDKLFGKNPSVLYEEYADKVGKSAGKLTDQEKAMALLDATMVGGEAVRGAYLEYVNSAAGQQEQLNNRTEQGKVAFGAALQPIRTLILQGLNKLLEVLVPAVEWIGKAANAVGVTLVQGFNGARYAGSKVIELLGKFTRVNALEEWGKKAADSALVSMAAVEATVKKASEQVTKDQDTAAKAVVKIDRDALAERKKEHEKFVKEVEKQTEDNGKKIEKLFADQTEASIKASKSMRELFGQTLSATMTNAADAIDKIRARMAEVASKVPIEEYRRLDEQAKNHVATLTLLNEAHKVSQAAGHGIPSADAVARLDRIIVQLQDQAALEFSLTGNAEQHRKRLEMIEALKARIRDLSKEEGRDAEAAAKSEDSRQKAVQKTAENVVGIARSALDAAQAFRVLDRNAASVLNSVLNIASAIGKIAGGDITSGVATIVTAVANIVSAMMQGDAERKRLLKVNNDALGKLSRDISGLRLNITGEDLAKAQSALSSVAGNLRGGRGAANENDVRNALYDQGLSMTDLDRIAKEFGMEIRSKSGALDVDSVKLLLQALNTAQIGRLGTNFQDQLAYFKESQRLDGASGASAIGGLIDFLRNAGGVTALAGVDTTDMGKTRDALRGLFTQLNNGQGVQGLGKLTGSQFMDVLIGLLGEIDGAAGAAGDSVVGSTGVTGSGGGSGTTAPSTETIQAVIKAMDSNVTTVLTAHTAFHERIANATEGAYQELQVHTGLLQQLVATTAGRTDLIDTELESTRYALAVQRGIGATY
jgi:hypothetical protein